MHPLIEQAGKKAAIAWIDGRTAWCAWFNGSLYAISGPGEQRLGPFAGRATVTFRGDHGGRIVSWRAGVEPVRPGTGEWLDVAPQLAGKRLNASGSTEELVARWAAECTIYAFRPGVGEVTAGDDLPSGSLAEPPRPTTAARPARRPFRLHRVRRR